MGRNREAPSRFIFYCTAPFLVALMVVLIAFARPVEASGWPLIIFIEFFAVMMLLGLYDYQRFHWCLRVVGALVFIAYVWYLVSTAMAGEWVGDGRKGAANAFNATIGLLVFGLPGLWYALFGRLTLRDTEVHNELEEFDER
jgi:hypothetical protein